MLCHVDGGSAFASFICEVVSWLHVHEGDEMGILGLRHTMFNVHRVTFGCIGVLQDLTVQRSMYSEDAYAGAATIVRGEDAPRWLFKAASPMAEMSNDFEHKQQ